MNIEENNTGPTVKPVYIVVEKSSNKKSIKDAYKSKAARIIGILHIVCGLVAFGTILYLFISVIYTRINPNPLPLTIRPMAVPKANTPQTI